MTWSERWPMERRNVEIEVKERKNWKVIRFPLIYCYVCVPQFVFTAFRDIFSRLFGIHIYADTTYTVSLHTSHWFLFRLQFKKSTCAISHVHRHRLPSVSMYRFRKILKHNISHRLQSIFFFSQSVTYRPQCLMRYHLIGNEYLMTSQKKKKSFHHWRRFLRLVVLIHTPKK